MATYALPANVAAELKFLAIVIESDMTNGTTWGV